MYTKTNWVNGSTPVNATNMNKIEVGIAANDVRSYYGTTVGGTANAITLTSVNFSFAVGESIKGIAAANNTTSMTAQVNGGTVYPIKKLIGSSYVDTQSDDFEDNKPFELICQNDGVIGDFFLLAPKGGASVRSIQRGKALITSTTTTLNITITEVDLNRAIVVLHQSLPNSAATDSRDYMIVADINTTTNLRLRRFASPTLNVEVYWEVIEYNNVKSLQKALILLDAGITTPNEQDVTITAVNVSKSIFNYSHAWNTYNDASLRGTKLGAGLKNSTQINFVKYVTQQMQVSYSVLEFN